MRHFLFEEKEYTFKFNWKRRREQDGAAKLVRRLRRQSGGGRSVRAPAPPARTPRAADLRQKCVAKAQYSSSIEAHRVQLKKYLVRDGTAIDGGRAELFGTDGAEYKENMVGKNFRIFLSPQNPGVDPRKLAENFVKRLELQTGYRLFWQGACHYNTAHPHAHLLINGVDRAGRDVQFPRDVIKTFMRESARALCTEQLGNRTLRDLAIEREAELSAPRFTRVDKKILERYGGRVSAEEARHVPGVDARRVRETLIKSNLISVSLCNCSFHYAITG